MGAYIDWNSLPAGAEGIKTAISVCFGNGFRAYKGYNFTGQLKFLNSRSYAIITDTVMYVVTQEESFSYRNHPCIVCSRYLRTCSRYSVI